MTTYPRSWRGTIRRDLTGGLRRWLNYLFPDRPPEPAPESVGDIAGLDHLTHESGVLVPKLNHSSAVISSLVAELLTKDAIDTYHLPVFEPTIQLWSRHLANSIDGDHLRARMSIQRARLEQSYRLRRREDQLAATGDELMYVEEQIRAVHAAWPQAQRWIRLDGGPAESAEKPAASGRSATTEEEQREEDPR
ncbi:hypothetical protein [Cryptosporangium sp. NPDC048952]|uniref:hypothetical protein n=1 Tax=Cryptosporangium sp. NPDC048952 TaxID=3363961 RepID=UPI00371987F8